MTSIGQGSPTVLWDVESFDFFFPLTEGRLFCARHHPAKSLEDESFLDVDIV